MLLKLNESKLFTVDTAIRFGEHYKVEPAMWNEIWRRHLEGYDRESLAGYFLYKTNKRISTRQLRVWLMKTEVYCRANHIMMMGVRVVSSEYFGAYEQFVLEETLRNMKYSGSKESRIMV